MFSLNVKKTVTAGIIGFPFIILLLWFYAKIFQFQYLNEAFPDGIATLQLSRGWLEGRPFLYDTYTGYHALQHNYYFILIIGFITKYTGIYGLFIVYLGLLALFLGKWGYWIRRHHQRNWRNEWTAVAFLAAGPVAFHIFWDYLGWHPEQYFIPLMVLLAFSLARRHWIEAIFWGFLTLTVKETSPVLIFGLLVFASVVSSSIRHPYLSWQKHYLNRRNGLIILGCLALFCLSMWWLSYLNGPKPSRLSFIFTHLQQHGSLWKWLLYTLILTVLSIIAVLYASLPFLAWLRITSKPWIVFGALVGGGSILCFVLYVEGLYYFPFLNSGLRYPPRIGSLWGFMMSCYVFGVVRWTEAGFKPAASQQEWTLFWGISQFVFSLLLVSNNQAQLLTINDAQKNLQFISTYKMGIRPYTGGTLKQLYELSKRLPTGAEVICEKEYLSIFQRVYATSWSWQNRHPFLGRPLLYIYDKQKLQSHTGYIFPKTGYIPIPNDAVLILADTIWYNQHYK
jgi:hypothetical protein